MKKAIFVKRYYRKHHGRAEFGGDVKAHTKRASYPSGKNIAIPLPKSRNRTKVSRQEAEFARVLSQYPASTQRAIVEGGPAVDRRLAEVYAEQVRMMKRKRETQALKEI